MAVATQATPDFGPLEELATPDRPAWLGPDRSLIAMLGDVLDDYAAQGRAIQIVDSWWRRFVARPRLAHLRAWADFVGAHTALHSTVQRPGITSAERGLGFRLGPP